MRHTVDMLDEDLEEWGRTREIEEELLFALRRRAATDCEDDILEVDVEVYIEDLCDDDILGAVPIEVYDEMPTPPAGSRLR
jgi:hypothetical protein